MFERIKEILKQYTEVDESVITKDANLQNDLVLNSLDLTNIIVEFEDEFGISIADDEVGNFITVRDIETYIKNKMVN